MNNETAILLLNCPNGKGIVANVAKFIYENGGDILHADQHIDEESKTLFMRIEWSMKDFKIEGREIPRKFLKIANKFNMEWELKFSSEIPNVCIFVTKEEHCLIDVLLKQKSGELKCKIPLVISNHPDLKDAVNFFGIDYHVIKKEGSKQNKLLQEDEELKLLKKYNIDLIVLAKYMQILSKNFISCYENKVINVHHSFLPAFKGAKPYTQAYNRGVKLIGATAHYATYELDNGPIIEQEIIRISHREGLNDIINKGKDIEKAVLSRAVKLHLENKILVYKNKTVVFD